MTTTRYLDDKEYKAATNYIRLNCDEVESYISEEMEKTRECKQQKNALSAYHRERGSGSLAYNCGVQVKDVPLVDILFQGDIGITETSRIDVDVQDIGTLVHELGKLESVDIHGRSSIMDEDENNEDEEKMVRGSKTRAYPKTSTPPTAASIPSRTTPSPAVAPQVETSTPPTEASIPWGMSSSPPATSTPPKMSGSGFYISGDLESILVTAILEYNTHLYSYGFIYCGDVIEAFSFIISMSTSTYPFIRPFICPFIPGRTGENRGGLCTVGPVCPSALAKGIMGQYTIQQVLGEQKGHVYGLGSRSAAITAEHQGGSSTSSSSIPSVSSVAAHESNIERERRLCGYMQQA
ncbi:hypothetical protein M9H77_21735 [Catharanthus roseus]|uniref:Uncharacterized protein n=1 Tax=Catharanthus roseus TaxID=4058 RepID=A0ACC0AN48_CATRO|nr:hypothetical protein M9H77_21735 [Catharanthus roseus]